LANDEFDLDIQLTEEREEDRSQQGDEPTTLTQITCFQTCSGGTCTTCVRVPC